MKYSLSILSDSQHLLRIQNPPSIPRIGESITIDKNVYMVQIVNYEYDRNEAINVMVGNGMNTPKEWRVTCASLTT
jgi:hypothetical protein